MKGVEVYRERKGQRDRLNKRKRYWGKVEKEKRWVDFTEDSYAMWDTEKTELVHSTRLQHEAAYHKCEISLIS